MKFYYSILLALLVLVAVTYALEQFVGDVNPSIRARRWRGFGGGYSGGIIAGGAGGYGDGFGPYGGYGAGDLWP
ncbi:hypothetical protein L596_017555 [Steinernema carpocapsae]|uniref:Uncharacterized protein n=1 Tax=Steinernema carpocapsae TaxID=34508 RepID=A0A4U5N2F3_STECR|nr:hypothetical protein L596_017555 [Steinernema carpocapsae]